MKERRKILFHSVYLNFLIYPEKLPNYTRKIFVIFSGREKL